MLFYDHYCFAEYLKQTLIFILPENSVKYLSDTKRKSNIILTGVISEIPDYDIVTPAIKLLLRTGEIFTGKDTIFAEGL